jgi:hypothetical protein
VEELLTAWNSPKLSCVRHDYNFQNEFPFFHLIPPEQAANPHRFCDDWFVNQKNKGKEKKDHKLLCPLPKGTWVNA